MTMTLRKTIILVVGIALIGAAVGLNKFMSSLKEPPEKRPQVEFKKFVHTKVVNYSDIPSEIIAYGRVKTAVPLDLISEVSGRLQQGAITLREGQRFKKGTLLYKIDDTQEKFNLQSQKSNFLKDVAAILPDIKIDFSDNFPAWESYFKSIDLEKPLPSLPSVKTEKEKTFLATKNIYGTFYTIKSQEDRLSKHYYYAPFDGSISLLNLQTGSFVNTGTNIGRVLQTDMLELKLSVDTKDIRWVNKGSTVTIVGEDQVSEWKGTIIRISEFVNSNTQSIDVFVAINPGQAPLYDGQYFRALIPGSVVSSALEIPRNALFEGNYVYLLRDSFLHSAPVHILKMNAETVIINGLEENSELVIEPLVNAYSGMKVFRLSDKELINLEMKSEPEEIVKR